MMNHQIDEQFEASLAIMLLHSSSFFRSPSLSSMAAASDSKPRKGNVISVIRERSVTCSESKSSNRDITSVIRGEESDLLSQPGMRAVEAGGVWPAASGRPRVPSGRCRRPSPAHRGLGTRGSCWRRPRWSRRSPAAAASCWDSPRPSGAVWPPVGTAWNIGLSK